MSHNEQNFAQKLREKGYRLTPQREIVLDTLCEIGEHATINQIFEKVHVKAPAVDKATVYRSIQLFLEHDFVRVGKMFGETVYEITPPDPHHHLVCQQCQKVIPLSDNHFDHLSQHIIEEHGFVPNFNHLTITGICAECTQKNNDKKSLES